MPTARIPNLWHLFLFLGITFFAFMLAALFGYGLTHAAHVSSTAATQLAQAFAYVLAVAVAFLFFPFAWQQPFFSGIRWNAAALRWWLVPLGLALGFTMQGISIFIPHPKDLPIEDLFHNHALIWFLAVFAIILGPLFEEIVFRGFVLPAIAIAVDYLRIPQNPDPAVASENLAAWRASSFFTPLALTLSTVLTSLLFALLHAPQLGYTWAAIALLAGVSIVLCIVRLRAGSVAASCVVHMSYNLSIFISLFLVSGGFRHLDRI